jgi:hypothetical protein
VTSNGGLFSTDTAAVAPWNSTLKSDRTIKYKPEEAVLGYEAGNEIKPR